MKSACFVQNVKHVGCIQGQSAMSHAAWGEVWNRALVLFGAEPIEIRIFVGLTVAFAAVMMLEGMRVSFLPAGWLRPRPHDIPAALQPANRVSRAKGGTTQVFEIPPAKTRSASGPFRPPKAGRTSTPKRLKVRASRHRAERPKIRRRS